MESLKFSSCMAANADPICRKIAAYLNKQLPLPVEFVNGIPWQERERLLDSEQIHICWICGLPYVQRANQSNAPIELLAAPVMRGTRYQDRPVYFSDVVVHQDSRFRSFRDLEGAVWAYNEPNSHSGYSVVAYHLFQMGTTWSFFGKVIESGAHQRSLEMILGHQIDASAIDSTVLELELRRNPEICSRIRIIEGFGPSPIPPLVILRSVPQALRDDTRDLLLQMHRCSQGQMELADSPIARFVQVEDSYYNPIRSICTLTQSSCAYV